ncbi:MAG: antibiotic biosynthesis monooxygenase [Cryomorphaceae bacterium]|nr:antibiotic biosynthesis monooxygenase [Cryomorphaceae bacterium]
MIIRIVKMQFDPEKVDAFQQIFHANKHRIQEFSGCNQVDLLRDITNDNVFFTYSHWEDTEALENYRNSDTFRDIWSKTKVLFNSAPEAWSVKKQ